jgi:outer membrane protein
MNLKLILLLIVSTSFTLSQELLTPEDAIKIALKNNFSINIAKNEAEVASNNSTIGNAGMLPSLDANGSYSKTVNNTTQEYYDGRRVERNGAKSSTLSAGIALNWTIFDGLKMFTSLDRLKSLKEVGELNFKSQVESDISDIIITYHDIVRLNEVIKVIQSNILISEARVKIAGDKMQVGSGSKFDLRQAQVDLNEDKSSLLREELNLSQSKISLNTLFGLKANNDFKVIDTITLKGDLKYEDILPLAMEKNSQLRIASENKTISELNINLLRSEIFPQISLSAGYNYTKSESEAGLLQINRNNGFNYGITASLNLFNGLTTRLNIENAQIELKNNELSYKEAEQSVEANLSNAFNRYENSRKIIELENENLTSAEENLDIALERLRLGNITPLEFRETQINLVNAKSKLVEAQYEAKTAETDLLRISGQLVTD